MPPDPLIIATRDGAPSHQPPVDLGARLRELRTERGWSLDAASDRTGLSRSSLYKIEKGKMSPTFDALKKLSDGFDLDVARLVVTQIDTRAASRRCITRHGDGTLYETETYTYVPLAEDLAHKAMLPFRLSIKARALDDFDDWDRHDTEDFVHVLSGTMILFTEYYEPLTLEPGDNVYYDGRMGHACISTSPDDAVVLWVSSTGR
ncbi:MAG: XRE family transcriptional regulator [Pseudomonadota bacterium]